MAEVLRVRDEVALRKLAKEALAGVRRCIRDWNDSPANAARWLADWRYANYDKLRAAGVENPHRITDFDPWAYQ